MMCRCPLLSAQYHPPAMWPGPRKLVRIAAWGGSLLGVGLFMVQVRNELHFSCLGGVVMLAAVLGTFGVQSRMPSQDHNPLLTTVPALSCMRLENDCMGLGAPQLLHGQGHQSQLFFH